MKHIYMYFKSLLLKRQTQQTEQASGVLQGWREQAYYDQFDD